VAVPFHRALFPSYHRRTGAGALCARTNRQRVDRMSHAGIEHSALHYFALVEDRYGRFGPEADDPRLLLHSDIGCKISRLCT
jgi:hypothetical protein